MSRAKQDIIITKKDAVHSQARVIGLLADGYRLLLICNHLLDNTKQPKAEDYSVSVEGEELPVKAAFLASPMLANSSWAAITLLLGKMVPKNAELKVDYKQEFNAGLLSLVDRKRLASVSVNAWSNQEGALTLHDGSGVSCSPAQSPSESVSAVTNSKVDLAPLNALRQRLGAKDAVKVQEELFFDYVSSMFDGEELESDLVTPRIVSQEYRSQESEAIPTLTLVAPNPERPLPVRVARVITAADNAEVNSDPSDVVSASQAKIREKREPEKHHLLQSLLNSTTGLMLGRGALIRSK